MLNDGKSSLCLLLKRAALGGKRWRSDGESVPESWIRTKRITRIISLSMTKAVSSSARQAAGNLGGNAGL
ncbi:hypothetical protein NBRC111894_2804 [Sporolactobacillus inulinus]|uniref:Uncharacterized protein n=1 Tax=Sporolactobacillus inulinus TaxID=2078 RepID=A0A4Y1ZE84_9BACL|nr:hypothetical protein NBRC111894_2804 [Sporolactobacillus inulinus]